VTLDPATADPPILRVRSVTKAFDGLEVLRRVDLDVRTGERHVVIGPNGAGKTTLFNVITGQVPPTQGSLLFAGQDITRMPVHRRARLGLGRTFQIASLFRHLSVWDNLVIAAAAPAAGGQDAEPAAERLLETAGLAARRHTPVSALAYGEQRRLEVALALAVRPRVLLLDEPMAGLSRDERRALADRIIELSGQTPILLTDHDLEIAMRIAQRLTVLHLGEVLCSGLPDEIRNDDRVRRVYIG
jgi:ABC-type branched-subunit amino acid transport system ATPase component